jgi:hypothetical protein
MSTLSFLKVTLVPETIAGSGVIDTEILLPVSAILAIRKKMGFEYEIVLQEKYHLQLEAHYFGKSAKLKEVKAKIKDESIFY